MSKLELEKHLQNKALFSLFHHDVEINRITKDIHTKELLNRSMQSSKLILNDLARGIVEIISENTNGMNDSDISLTLTGGMDSRLILAALLNLGIKPNCITYGNPSANDAIHAKYMADKLGLKFHIACQNEPTKEWYYKWVVETILRDNGNAHLHRAHRTAAMAEHSEIFHPKVLFTGHMGGEGLRGLTYNNYFASQFFEWTNEKQMDIESAAMSILNTYFINVEDLNLPSLIKSIRDLSWMGTNKKFNKFFFLYDLIAKVHHMQDIRIYRSYIPTVVPVFLTDNYLQLLFGSQFNFLNKSPSFTSRLNNPLVYCKLIETLYPKLLDFPLSNGFTPAEYLKGLWYYVPIKLLRKKIHRNKYPPSFSYGKWFNSFVLEQASAINNDIWEIYNREKYFSLLSSTDHRTDEGYWHKYSNPVFFNLKRELLNSY